MLQYLQMKKVTVNLISESVFTVQGHGVHTAFIEMENLLAKQPSINLLVNQRHVRDIHDYDATFGDLVIRSDEDHFATTIKRYLTDKQLYADGVKRSHRIASRYDTTKTERQLLDLYRSLLNDNSEAAGV